MVRNAQLAHFSIDWIDNRLVVIQSDMFEMSLFQDIRIAMSKACKSVGAHLLESPKGSKREHVAVCSLNAARDITRYLTEESKFSVSSFTIGEQLGVVTKAEPEKANKSGDVVRLIPRKRTSRNRALLGALDLLMRQNSSGKLDELEYHKQALALLMEHVGVVIHEGRPHLATDIAKSVECHVESRA